ncbi:MAG TPA: putative 2OG-Fe(II) oxygenase [Rhizomicrobium sp.]|nr:putative 2OG-Fe(II) oxygenase [Rhizomicrobium sp.]
MSDAVAQGADLLAQGDFKGAERIALDRLAMREDPAALHLLGLVRIHQEKPEDAVKHLTRSLQLHPRQAAVLLNLGKAYMAAGRAALAQKALAEAVIVRPDLADAWFTLGELAGKQGDDATAEANFRKAAALGHLPAQLLLGLALCNTHNPAEAENILARGLAQAEEPRLKTAFMHQLACAQRAQGKRNEALANFTEAGRRDPGLNADLSRADLLLELSRPDEALAVLEERLKQDPGDALTHHAYNHILYRLGRDQEFLKSYDSAPPLTPLQLAKAGFLLMAGRNEEAHALYAAIMKREPADISAAIGAAVSLAKMGQVGTAMAPLEHARRLYPRSVPVLQELAALALQARDEKKSAAFAEQALKLAPDDYLSLALMGTAWRMAGDERDEALNGYDDLVQVFDLEPPRGFASMAEFNQALNGELSGLHNTPREPLSQSLRQGSQSLGALFGVGNALVERLKERLEESLHRYIGGIKAETGHPFRGRQRQGFRFSGSWSSRLRDSGFHTNHIHPEGWISSCYYVAVPDAARDEREKQGWIKFGEPNFECGLGFRRAIQPKPGRLVLFPSYMWHGTILFHDNAQRTTIAFDAVPR